jgi:2-keto-4-pentenoate hydratase/2-oxohepta-3-ene-1,7-dioic acid hydratase in catechol pathway
MKLITFEKNASEAGNSDNFGIGALASNGDIVDLTPIAQAEGLSAVQLLRCFDLDSGFLGRARDFVISGTSSKLPSSSVRIAACVPRPGKIICIGLNYRDHAAESGMAIPSSPVTFSKYSSCSIAHNQPIEVPDGSLQTDYEAELAFVIGRRAKHVEEEDAMNFVFGYTNFNDVSARDFQFADGQWQRGKSCDTFAPMGPFITTTDEIGDPQDLSIKLRLNGRTMQDSNTGQMVFGVAKLVSFLSRSITLEPGDVVATGTPPGVGFARKPPVYLRDGDVVEVEIEGLGILSNPVSASHNKCST